MNLVSASCTGNALSSPIANPHIGATVSSEYRPLRFLQRCFWFAMAGAGNVLQYFKFFYVVKVSSSLFGVLVSPEEHKNLDSTGSDCWLCAAKCAHDFPFVWQVISDPATCGSRALEGGVRDRHCVGLISHLLPKEFDEKVAKLHLHALCVKLTVLTQEQAFLQESRFKTFEGGQAPTVHVDALWKARDMEARSLEKLVNMSKVN